MNTVQKLLHHPDRVAKLVNGEMPIPVMVDIDPVDGICNLNCIWCCQKLSRDGRKARMMERYIMQSLGSFCADWGIKAWRISGDSEPLLHPNIEYLISSGYDAGIKMGLITNGILLDKLSISDISKLSWIGVSLDAGCEETWQLVKGGKDGDWDRVINGVRSIKERMPNFDIALKYLKFDSNLNCNHVCKERNISNYADLPKFEKLASDLGVRTIVKEAYRIGDFPEFDECVVTPFGGVFDAYRNFHLCCDRRFDEPLTEDFTRDDWKELPNLWGGEKHRDLISQIDPHKCSMCAKKAQNEELLSILKPDESVHFV